jgi:hypothetical protein
MEVGKPQRIHRIEPIRDPVPAPPQPRPQEPVKAPS